MHDYRHTTVMCGATIGMLCLTGVLSTAFSILTCVFKGGGGLHYLFFFFLGNHQMASISEFIGSVIKCCKKF